MIELVGIDDRAHGLNLSVGDVERDDVDESPVGGQEPGTGLAVDGHRLVPGADPVGRTREADQRAVREIGRASCRERV